MLWCAGALSALLAGGALVLPSWGAGVDDSTTAAAAAVRAVERESCTVVLADTHSLRAMSELG